MSLCRDGFHMSYLYGRYVLGAVWYRALGPGLMQKEPGLGTLLTKIRHHIAQIGNSFSEDATHFLHQIAEADNVSMKVVNLYIGSDAHTFPSGHCDI